MRNSSSQPTPSRRSVQFSLRALLLVMSLVAAYFSGWSVGMKRALEFQQQAEQERARAEQAQAQAVMARAAIERERMARMNAQMARQQLEHSLAAEKQSGVAEQESRKFAEADLREVRSESTAADDAAAGGTFSGSDQ